ncbi:hypothetical protein Tco_1384240 [Tanacetum coccineum]
MSAAIEALIAAVAATLPSSPPPSPLTPLSSLLPHIPSPPLTLPSPPTHISPTYDEAPLGYRAAGTCRFGRELTSLLSLPDLRSTAVAARQPGLDVATMDATPRRPMSREVGYGIEDVWDDMVRDMEERASTTIEGLS